MTKKPTPPAAPSAAKAKKDKTFWDHILEIQKVIEDTAYGVGAGKGGSTLKDSNRLRMDAHKMLRERGITYDVYADDVELTIAEGHTFVTGYYIDNWYMNGELVYSSRRFSGFDSPISPSTNVNYAVQGAVTSATTIALFGMLKANTQDEEELQSKREQHMNRQHARPPAASGGGSYY